MAPKTKNNEQSPIGLVDGVIIPNVPEPDTNCDYFLYRASAFALWLGEKLVRCFVARFIESRVRTDIAFPEIRPGVRQVQVVARVPPPYAALQRRRVYVVKIARAAWVLATLAVILAWLHAAVPVSANAVAIKLPKGSIEVALGRAVVATAGNLCSAWMFRANIVAAADLTCKIDAV